MPVKFSKLSQYKLKKILNCFTDDLTSSNAAIITKISRNTVDKYYNLFRNIIVENNVEEHKKYKLGCENCYGLELGECYQEVPYKIHKIGNRFFPIRLPKRTKFLCLKKHILYDKEYQNFITYNYQRISKFHGLSLNAGFSQLQESAFRYHFSKEQLFNIIWKELRSKLY